MFSAELLAPVPVVLSQLSLYICLCRVVLKTQLHRFFAESLKSSCAVRKDISLVSKLDNNILGVLFVVEYLKVGVLLVEEQCEFVNHFIRSHWLNTALMVR